MEQIICLRDDCQWGALAISCDGWTHYTSDTCQTCKKAKTHQHSCDRACPVYLNSIKEPPKWEKPIRAQLITRSDGKIVFEPSETGKWWVVQYDSPAAAVINNTID